MSRKEKEILPLGYVDISLLTYNSCKPAPHTLDVCQGDDDLLSSIDVRVQNTQDVLKIVLQNNGLVVLEGKTAIL